MWGAWRLVLEGKYLYSMVTVPGATPCLWPNPPSFTFLTSPLGLLEPRTAAVAWFYLKLALLIWVGFALKRLNERAPHKAPWGVAVPVVLTACWAAYDFALGHMNLVAIGLMLASLVAYLEGRHWPAALYGSLAVICKGPAAVIVPFYLARRQFRLGLRTLGLCLAWIALPAVVWGPAKTWEYNRDFVRSVQYESIYSDIEVGWAENWSLPALVVRLLGPVPAADRYEGALDLLQWSKQAAEGVAKAVASVGLLACAAWWFKGPGRSPHAGFASPELHHAALAATATLVFSPVTRKAYLATLLLPYFVLWGYLLTTRLRRSQRLVATLCVLSVLLSYLTHADLLGKSTAFFFEQWHVLTLSLLLLLGAQIIAARTVERAEDATEDAARVPAETTAERDAGPLVAV